MSRPARPTLHRLRQGPLHGSNRLTSADGARQMRSSRGHQPLRSNVRVVDPVKHLVEPRRDRQSPLGHRRRPVCEWRWALAGPVPVCSARRAGLNPTAGSDGWTAVDGPMAERSRRDAEIRLWHRRGTTVGENFAEMRLQGYVSIGDGHRHPRHWPRHRPGRGRTGTRRARSQGPPKGGGLPNVRRERSRARFPVVHGTPPASEALIACQAAQAIGHRIRARRTESVALRCHGR